MIPFLAELTHSIQGTIYLPGDEGFQQEVEGYNTAVSHTPSVVVRVNSTEDVALAIRFARFHGLEISVKSTGHGYYTSIRSGMLITTNQLNRVSIDPEARLAVIGAGVCWKEVVEASAPYGLTPIAGSSVDVGVVGYLLGGGVGPLVRSHGISSDYLIELTVVTPKGEICRASEAENEDLFWALRGGKIGFGIVTEVTVRLEKMPELYAGSLFFEEHNIERALRGWMEWTEKAHPLVTTSVAVIRFPPIPAIPEKFRGRRLLSLRFAYPGSVEEGAVLAAPLRALAPVYDDAIGQLPASEIGRIHSDPSQPMPFWALGVLLDKMDQKCLIPILEEFGAGKETPFTALEIRHLGSAAAVDVPEGSSVGGRSAEYAVGFVGRDPLKFKHHFEERGNRLVDALRPWMSEEGNINLMGTAIPGRHFARMWPQKIEETLDKIRRKFE